jgi:hypothetical protein
VGSLSAILGDVATYIDISRQELIEGLFER